jgi:hypothetical protein
MANFDSDQRLGTLRLYDVIEIFATFYPGVGWAGGNQSTQMKLLSKRDTVIDVIGINLCPRVSIAVNIEDW